MESSSQLPLIWGYRWWLTILAVVASVSAYFTSAALPLIYQATALVQVVPGQQAAGDFLSEDELLSVTNFYAELGRTTTLVELTKEATDHPGSISSLQENLSIEPQEHNGILELIATDGHAETAADLVEAYSESLVLYVAELQQEQKDSLLSEIRERVEEIEGELELATGIDRSDVEALRTELTALQTQVAEEVARPTDSARIIQAAAVPREPSSPQPIRDAILAALAALVIGVLLAYARISLTDHYSSAQEAVRELSLPLLGELPRPAKGDRSIELFRTLWTGVDFKLRPFLEGDRVGGGTSVAGGATVLVTSPEPRSGKSFVTANLARASAVDGQSVVAVDGDLRKPTLNSQFRLGAEAGLGDLLASERPANPRSLAVSVDVGTEAAKRGGALNVLTAGHFNGVAEELSGPKMSQVLRALGSDSDLVLVDSPPVLAVVDPILLAKHADVVLLVVDAHRTRRCNARRAMETLRAMDVPVLGFVFNGAKIDKSRAAYY